MNNLEFLINDLSRTWRDMPDDKLTEYLLRLASAAHNYIPNTDDGLLDLVKQVHRRRLSRISR